ncbi:MAG: alanine/ornithine racemase family PLP-dependent enzyme [Defluviitaleaceae bacterium]|nr:alanine/ornithine racemase family PLP-dependent enzyme [Defluviitaleaceae bacterium]
MNPRLLIDLKKLTHNANHLANLCNERGISVTAVTKVFCAEPPMVQALAVLPIAYMADSRLENIASYPKDMSQKTILLRLPAPSQADEVVRICDISLNSEMLTLQKLAEAANKRGIVHGVIIMIDLGDLREGIFHNATEKINATVEYVLSQKSLELKGFGTNLTCYGAVLPTVKNLTMLTKLCYNISKEYNLEIPIISGGNSSSLYMLEKGEIPQGISNLRLGEAIVCGKETAYGDPYPSLELDVVVLEAEIIEIADKPSHPEGEININAFGEKMAFEDKGIRKRAILAVGRQDTDYEGLTPLNDDVEIVGASSDHLIVDITDAAPLAVGDRLRFSLSYGAILAGFTSKYVDKEYKY